MFRPKTVFVLGAGASYEAGLPLGTELAYKIKNLLYFQFESFKGLSEGDYEFLDSLKRELKNNNDEVGHYLKAARIISDGILLTESIDNFIDTHRGDKYIAGCGKAAIVRLILDAEKQSKLMIVSKNAFDKLDVMNVKDTWYRQFISILAEGVSVEDLDTIFDNVAIISFNYDRSLEHFLVHALQPIYNINEGKAAALISKLNIIYPYGSVGPLKTSARWNGIEYGKSASYIKLLESGGSIKTYTEVIVDGDDTFEIKKLVAEAETLVFLGFAFHKQNIRLLQPNGISTVKKILATGLGLSNDSVQNIEQQLVPFLEPISIKETGMMKISLTEMQKSNIDIRNELTCNDLLREFRRSLSPL